MVRLFLCRCRWWHSHSRDGLPHLLRRLRLFLLLDVFHVRDPVVLELLDVVFDSRAVRFPWRRVGEVGEELLPVRYLWVVFHSRCRSVPACHVREPSCGHYRFDDVPANFHVGDVEVLHGVAVRLEVVLVELVSAIPVYREVWLCSIFPCSA